MGGKALFIGLSFYLRATRVSKLPTYLKTPTFLAFLSSSQRRSKATSPCNYSLSSRGVCILCCNGGAESKVAINLIKSRRGEILGIQFPAALALISVYAFLNHQAAEGSPTLFFSSPHSEMESLCEWKSTFQGTSALCNLLFTSELMQLNSCSSSRGSRKYILLHISSFTVSYYSFCGKALILREPRRSQ